MKEQIQHMQRLQLAGTLAGGIAHDLNNELTLILGNLELVLDRLPPGHDAIDRLELAQTAASRCAAMSRRLLDIGRPTRSLMKPMDVAAAIHQAHLMLECIKPPHIIISAESEPALLIAGDAAEIQQAVINLGMNAVQSMPQGGYVRIEARRRGTDVVISVCDAGCGIPKSQCKRIFEPFFSTRAESGASGLGLSAVRSIAEHHQGVISVHSTPGEGSTFTIELPALVEEEELDEPLAA